jgi:hypothetical protein
MREIKGHKIDVSMVHDLKKIYDLIEYDGPILSHFKDSKGKNYFYLWVERYTNFNRWLIWKVDDLELHQYLMGKRSLRELVLSPTKEFIYVADIDSNLNYLNLIAADINDIPNEYIPDNDSLYELEFDGVHPYEKFIDEKNREFYFYSLKENSVFLKIENSDFKHGKFVGLAEINAFIASINSSYKNYIAVDFYNKFHGYFSDVSRLKSMLNSAQEVLDLRGVEFHQSSFEIGLAIDKVMIGSKLEDVKLRRWAYLILDRYNQDVIKLDYNNEEEIQRIMKIYSNEQRSMIYDPFIKLSKNKKIKFSYRENPFEKKYKPIKINEDKALKISPKSEKKIIEEEEKFELINALAWVRKGDKKITLTEDNTLFSRREGEYTYYLTSEDFIKEGFEIDIPNNIMVEVSSMENQIVMTAFINDKDFTVSSDDNKKAKSKLLKILFEELKENLQEW